MNIPDSAMYPQFTGGKEIENDTFSATRINNIAQGCTLVLPCVKFKKMYFSLKGINKKCEITDYYYFSSSLSEK